MKHGFTIVAAAVAAIALSGCASIMSGPVQELKVSSNPAGAVVYIGTIKNVDGLLIMSNRTAVGVTPMTVRMYRKDGALALEKAGYEPVQVRLMTKMNPWVWGDIAMLSPLSTSIDTSTGASTQYDPGEYMVDMKRISK